MAPARRWLERGKRGRAYHGPYRSSRGRGRRSRRPTFSPTTSVSAFVRGVGVKSFRQAIWHYKLRRIRELFGGGTSEEQEDEALAILLSAESGDEAVFLINNIVHAITGAGATFQDLVAAVQGIADAIGDFSVPDLFGTDSDALAVNTVNVLAGQEVLALLPTVYKSELVNRLLSLHPSHIKETLDR